MTDPRARPRPQPPSTPEDPWSSPKITEPGGGLLDILYGMLWDQEPIPGSTDTKLERMPTDYYVDHAMDQLGYGHWNPVSEYLDESGSVPVSSLDLTRYDRANEAMGALLNEGIPRRLGNVDPRWSNAVQRDYLYATEMPLAELGYEPERFHFNDAPDDAMYDLGGFRNQLTGDIGITSARSAEVQPAILHEAIHAGLGALGHEFSNSGEEEGFIRAYIDREVPGQYRQTDPDMMSEGIAGNYEWFTQTRSGQRRLDELITRFDDLANKRLGERYDEWAGAMD